MCICNDLHDAQGDEDSTAVAEMEEQFSNMKAIPHDHRLLVYVIGKAMLQRGSRLGLTDSRLSRFRERDLVQAFGTESWLPPRLGGRPATRSGGWAKQAE